MILGREAFQVIISNVILFFAYKFRVLKFCMRSLFFRKLLRGKVRVKAWGLLGAEIELNVRISSGVSILFPENVKIGSGTAINGRRVEIHSWGKVTLGRNVLVNDDVFLYSAGHPIDSPNLDDGTESIEIGDYAWLPHHIIVLPGVKIGNYAVIGTGAVVSRNIPDYGVAVGNPAKVVKSRAKQEYTYIPSER